MKRIIEDMALTDSGGDLIEIDVVDIRAGETDLLQMLIEPADQVLEIRERMPGGHPAQRILLRHDESHHKRGQHVAGIISQIVVQKEREIAQRSIFQGFQRLRILEVDTEIVRLMENSTQRRLDNLEGIGINRRLRLLRQGREMIDEQMMQAGLIPSSLLKP
jgi:hypothetical protein